MELPTFNETEHDPDYPSYSTPGNLIIEIFHVYAPNIKPWQWRNYEVEGMSFNIENCTFLIEEGEGIDYWVNAHLDIELPGFYVVENIVGDYIKGEWGYTDDDVDWDFECVRYATPEEIAKFNNLRNN